MDGDFLFLHFHCWLAQCMSRWWLGTLGELRTLCGHIDFFLFIYTFLESSPVPNQNADGSTKKKEGPLLLACGIPRHSHEVLSFLSGSIKWGKDAHYVVSTGQCGSDGNTHLSWWHQWTRLNVTAIVQLGSWEFKALLLHSVTSHVINPPVEKSRDLSRHLLIAMTLLVSGNRSWTVSSVSRSITCTIVWLIPRIAILGFELVTLLVTKIGEEL